MNKVTLMKFSFITKILLGASVLSISLVSNVYAHSGGTVLGPDGTNPNATVLVAISCFDDGNGEPAKLFAQIKDQSSPVAGSFVSVQMYKGIKAISTTDNISGDADYSQGIELEGGSGVYWVMITKTTAEPRQFDLIWHCMTDSNTHTGTDIVIRQIQ